MLKRTTASEKVFYTVNFLIVLAFVLLVLYPLIFVVAASFSDPRLLYENPLVILPRGFNVESYKTVFENKLMWSGLANSLFETIVGTSLNVVMTILAAYPLSRKDLVGKNIFVTFFAITMFFSGGMIPTYIVVDVLGLTNTLWALIFPTAVGFTNVVIMRTYFTSTIPEEIHEAANIDGCGHLQALLRIVIPLSTPIIAVIALWSSVWHWNSFFQALIYITNEETFTLQLVIRGILLRNEMDAMLQSVLIGSETADVQMWVREGLKYAVVVVSSAPFVCMFPFFQKYFSKGVMIGSIKG